MGFVAMDVKLNPFGHNNDAPRLWSNWIVLLGNIFLNKLALITLRRAASNERT